MNMDENWTEDALAHRETAVAHEAFERQVEDDGAYVRSPEALVEYERAQANLDVGLNADGTPWRDPRLGEIEHCDGFDRYTVTADASAEDDLLKAVSKINNMVKRHGGEVRIVGQVSVRTEHPWMKQRVRGPEGRGWVYRPKMVDSVIFTIEAPAVAGEHAKLVGAFELAEDGVQVYLNAAPGYSANDMEPFRARWWECDHCGYDRRRHASFVCEKADGSRTLIGRQCSMAFLGLSPTELLARAACAKLLSGGGDTDDEGFFGGGSNKLYVPTIMERAYRVAKHFHGYSKLIRKEFHDHMAALAGRRDEKGSWHYGNIRAMYAAKPALEPMDLEGFANWLAEGQAKSDFISNCYVAFSSDFVKPKRFNLIVAGVGIFVGNAVDAANKARLEKQQRDPALPAAKHAAYPAGARFECVGTVVHTHPYDTDYGAGLMIFVRCDDGVSLLHFCKGKHVPDKGDRVHVKATVTKHGADRKNNEPQTIVSRAVYTKQEEA